MKEKRKEGRKGEREGKRKASHRKQEGGPWLSFLESSLWGQKVDHRE